MATEEPVTREDLLASDRDRDAATRLIADGFADGRLDRADFEDRSQRALAARTHGELAVSLRGLGGLRPVGAPAHPGRKVVFWVMTVLTSPFLLLGAFALAFGSDLGDRGFGIVVGVLFLPGLLALHGWAWPRPGRGPLHWGHRRR